MIWQLIILAMACALFLLVLSMGAAAKRGDVTMGIKEQALVKCPLCSRWTTIFELADFDGINMHCNRCLGFIGIRRLGSEPEDHHLVKADRT